MTREIGTQIRSSRERRGWTVTRLAEEVGVSRSYLSRIESGERRIHAELLTRLAEALEVQPQTLLGESDLKRDLRSARRKAQVLAERIRGSRRLNPDFVHGFIRLCRERVFPDDPELHDMHAWRLRMEELMNEDDLLPELTDSMPALAQRLLAIPEDRPYQDVRREITRTLERWPYERRDRFVRDRLADVLPREEWYEAAVGAPVFAPTSDRRAGGGGNVGGSRPLPLAGTEAAPLPGTRAALLAHLRGGDVPTVRLDDGIRDPDAFAVRVPDASMLPRLRPGDVVVCAPNSEAAGDDELVVAALATGRLSVRIRRREGERIGLEPVNPRYETAWFDPDEITGLFPVVRTVGL